MRSVVLFIAMSLDGFIAAPDGGVDCYVFTHRQASPVPGVRFVSCDPCALVDQLKARPGRDIWICGGAQLIRQLSDRIDRLQISVIPTLLGQGVRLFPALAREQKLRLTGVTHSNGIVELTYQPR